MLKDKKVGFIGAGMQGESIARGIIAKGFDPGRMSVSDPDGTRRDFFKNELGVSSMSDNRSLAGWAHIIILAVKPHVMREILSEIGRDIGPHHLIISVAAGVTLESIQKELGKDIPVLRAMPNTPALIGEGATAIAPGKYCSPEDIEMAQEIFDAVGKVVRVTEDKLNAVTGLSGSGPAFVYTFIEALADGGVRMGLPKSTALLLAAQTVAGAARLVLEMGLHPADLRDRVMTPGGTTIAGMASLERDGFRSAAIEAVTAATQRADEIAKS